MPRSACGAGSKAGESLKRICGEELPGKARRAPSCVKSICLWFRQITVSGFLEFCLRVQKRASAITCVWEAKAFKLLKQSWPHTGLKFSSGHSK